jgi:hypothetical protein
MTIEYISLREAARRLGISPTQAGQYAHTGWLPTIGTGNARQVIWTDGAPGVPDGALPGVTGVSYSAPPVHPMAYLDALVRQRDALAQERDWLRGQLEEAAVERAELQLVLAGTQHALAVAQQQVAEQSRALLAVPEPPVAMPVDAPERTATPPVSATLVHTPATVERALKQAGIRGKKARRRMADVLGALFGR